MESKKLIVLDLDATLISAQSLEKYDVSKNKRKAVKFNKQFTMDDYYKVFARPHLDVFLDYIFSNFSVAVWTAASQLYALSIVENLILTKPGRQLDFILFDYHNEHSIDKASGTKDLKYLETFYGINDYDDMVIIDDFEDVVAVNKDRAIKAPFFDFKKRNSHNDAFLLKVIQKLKKFKHSTGKKMKPSNSKNESGENENDKTPIRTDKRS